jgi:hypothetical protein
MPSTCARRLSRPDAPSTIFRSRARPSTRPVSNWAAWQIAIALGISAREGLARFELIQRMYNLVRRQAEVEILPLAAREKLGGITYSTSVAAC